MILTDDREPVIAIINEIAKILGYRCISAQEVSFFDEIDGPRWIIAERVMAPPSTEDLVFVVSSESAQNGTKCSVPSSSQWYQCVDELFSSRVTRTDHVPVTLWAAHQALQEYRLFGRVMNDQLEYESDTDVWKKIDQLLEYPQLVLNLSQSDLIHVFYGCERLHQALSVPTLMTTPLPERYQRCLNIVRQQESFLEKIYPLYDCMMAHLFDQQVEISLNAAYLWFLAWKEAFHNKSHSRLS